ncbi:MAG: hypothetical protein H8E44_28130 [Planctomycetes bacterium]|nr:hypothetical protein [Planctomycetota bacterium]MBL7043616.1 hypothetical protein [Pirellulaceae bacterium]
MLPQFDENGYLPPGIHRCEVDEIVKRFGTGSPEREVETQELLDFIEWARRAGIRRLVINGSFATGKAAPNDVDIVVLPGADYPRGENACTEEESRWPFLQIVVAVDDDDLQTWALEDFGTDRTQLKKGVVEVSL